MQHVFPGPRIVCGQNRCSASRQHVGDRGELAAHILLKTEAFVRDEGRGRHKKSDAGGLQKLIR